MSAKVKVVNAVWNGRGLLKRKVAEYYVAEGRAEWVGEGQLRLVLSHPKNMAAARAAACQTECNPDPAATHLSLAVAQHPSGLRAIDRRRLKFERRRQHVDGLIRPAWPSRLQELLVVPRRDVTVGQFMPGATALTKWPIPAADAIEIRNKLESNKIAGR